MFVRFGCSFKIRATGSSGWKRYGKGSFLSSSFSPTWEELPFAIKHFLEGQRLLTYGRSKQRPQTLSMKSKLKNLHVSTRYYCLEPAPNVSFCIFM